MPRFERKPISRSFAIVEEDKENINFSNEVLSSKKKSKLKLHTNLVCETVIQSNKNQELISLLFTQQKQCKEEQRTAIMRPSIGSTILTYSPDMFRCKGRESDVSESSILIEGYQHLNRSQDKIARDLFNQEGQFQSNYQFQYHLVYEKKIKPSFFDIQSQFLDSVIISFKRQKCSSVDNVIAKYQICDNIVRKIKKKAKKQCSILIEILQSFKQKEVFVAFREFLLANDINFSTTEILSLKDFLQDFQKISQINTPEKLFENIFFRESKERSLVLAKEDLDEQISYALDNKESIWRILFILQELQKWNQEKNEFLEQEISFKTKVENFVTNLL